MAKFIGYGIALKQGSTAIAQIKSITRTAAESNAVDTSTLDNTDRFRTKVGGMIDPGSVTFQLCYDPAAATHTALATSLESQSSTTYTIVYPTTTITQSFTAFVQSLGAEIPLDDVVTQDVTLMISGDPGWTT